MRDKVNVQMINNNKIQFMVTTSILLIFLSATMFTLLIPFTENFSFMALFSMISMLFFTAYIFRVLIENKPVLVFISVFILNGVGILLRVIFEWREYSLSEYLTIPMISIFLIVAPLVTTFCYYLLQPVIKSE